ncbi:MAG: division/cell wall cluster transcriptional repressor MraZ [Eubacterium sp.]|nr:division/cell wall cluster transcriptional repressor MraZ [Eubacterium sp.]
MRAEIPKILCGKEGEIVFQGEYHHGLDAKGRLILPARIREELGTQFVITKGMDGCLFIFTPDSWQEFSGKLRKLPTSSEKARRLKRYFIGSSLDCESDKQGRFLIPPVLRQFAQIDKDVTVIGLDDRIELWSTERYEAYQNEDDVPIEEIAGEMEF